MVDRWPRAFECLLALGFGGLLGAVFLPSPLSWLAPIPLAGIFGVIAESRRGRHAFTLGFLAGFAFFAFHLAWLPISFAQLFGPVGAAPMPFLAAVLGLMWGAAAGFARRLAPLGAAYSTDMPARVMMLLPFVWVILEWLRGLGPLSFTWGTLGYGLLPTPLIQVADLGGVPLASLFVTAMAAALAGLLNTPRRFKAQLPLALMLLAWVAALGYGLTRPAAASPNLEVLLVQGSVSPLEKVRGTVSSLALYERLSQTAMRPTAQRASAPQSKPSAQSKPALIVWPETAVPVAPTLPETRSVLERLGVPALIGAPSREDAIYQNSAFGFLNGVTGRYDKIKLVPFGEFFLLRDALGFIYDPIFNAFGLPGLRGATPGSRLQPIPLGAFRVGAYICYESTFPAISRMLVRGGANLLVNISNDAWFGRTLGAEQHFQMGRVRAIESRRYLARAGNDGITAIIDPNGWVLKRFPRGDRAAFRGRVALLDGRTLYTRLGDWVVWCSMLVLAGLVLSNGGVRGKILRRDGGGTHESE